MVNPRIEAVWNALEQIKDPEIDVLSIVELGIVREVAVDGDQLTITITPTYSGCPAMDVICKSIVESMNGLGFSEPKLNTVLAPAWTTEWMSDSAKEKLRNYGIAPPDNSGLVQLPEIVRCPRCNTAAAKEISRFGPTACKALWYCSKCSEPFEYFKAF